MELEALRAKVRLSGKEIDNELQDNIDSCIADMKRVGINTTLTDAKLIDKAIELYSKWQLNYMDKGEQFAKHYENLRDTLSMSAEYKE